MIQGLVKLHKYPHQIYWHSSVQKPEHLPKNSCDYRPPLGSWDVKNMKINNEGAARKAKKIQMCPQCMKTTRGLLLKGYIGDHVQAPWIYNE